MDACTYVARYMIHVVSPGPMDGWLAIDVERAERCREMSSDVERCREMSRDVERCREMSSDVERCREMSIDVERCQADP